MEGKGYPSFRIGTVANLTGINMQTIRRYDARGIINGKREDDSQYRFFDLLELTILIRTKMYRSYGFSLDEITGLLNEGAEQNRNLFGKRRDALAKEIARSKELLHCMEMQMQYLVQAPALTKACEIRTRPEMYGLFYYDIKALVDDLSRRKILSRWIEATPFVLPMLCLNKGYLNGGERILKVGLCVTREYAHMLNLGDDPFSFQIPACPCIYTMIDCVGMSGYPGDIEPAAPGWDSFKHIIDYSEEHGLALKEDMIGSTFFSTRENGKLRHISHLWIPFVRG